MRFLRCFLLSFFFFCPSEKLPPCDVVSKRDHFYQVLIVLYPQLIIKSEKWKLNWSLHSYKMVNKSEKSASPTKFFP